MNRIVIFYVFLISLWSCHSEGMRFDASGTFEAREVIISAETSGQIRQLEVREGAELDAGVIVGWIDSTQLHLKKRQLLAQIDAVLSRRPAISTQMASYRVQLETAERELNRVRNLFEAEAATQKQLDDARSQVAVVRRKMEAHRSALDVSTQGLVTETVPLSIQVEQVNDQLEKSRIVNPIGGIVLTKYAQAFELASPGRPLYKIADLSSLELRAYISGSQLADVRLGQDVRVFVDDSDGGYREYPGVITWISDKSEFTPKSVQTKDERANLVYAIKVLVENDGLLKIGMYGEVDL